jgi:hypothetical protein
MNRLKYSLYLLTACMLIAGGCATRRLDSAMIHYRPIDHMSKRPEQKLLEEIRLVLKFEVSADDFLSSHSVDGHTCWIILNHEESIQPVIDRIKKEDGYQYIAVGHFDPQYRSVFGFKPKPESIIDEKK